MARTRSSTSIPYTAAPLQLILSDLTLWLRITFVLPPSGLPSLILPIGPFNSGKLDEFYPTFGNYWAIFTQFIFILAQTFFLLSLVPAAFGIIPPWISGYTPVWTGYVLAFVLTTRWISRFVLNGWGKRMYVSDTGVTEDDKKQFEKEKWIFVNGVAAGQHWMQSNLDRLALTFRREVVGIHNETRGLLFDLIECILERTLGWATPSTRTVYAKLLEFISDDQYERIILILHSQGAIEGGLALDWLFATVPASKLARVEVYTFGSATNHFNNPSSSPIDDSGNDMPMSSNDDSRILRHIEHYANDKDYVSQFGVLNFRSRPGKLRRLFDPTHLEEENNMYAGRLFIRKGYGHQFNNNYLDNLFTLNKDKTQVLDNNPFMNSEIDESLLKSADVVAVREDADKPNTNSSSSHPRISTSRRRISFNPRVKDVSRLWEYRNGGIPTDVEDSDATNGSQLSAYQQRSGEKMRGDESDIESEDDVGFYPDGRKKKRNWLKELD